jgi:hypothetical protein
MGTTCINLLLLMGGNSNRSCPPAARHYSLTANRSHSLISISLSDMFERGMIEQVVLLSSSVGKDATAGSTIRSGRARLKGEVFGARNKVSMKYGGWIPPS